MKRLLYFAILSFISALGCCVVTSCSESGKAKEDKYIAAELPYSIDLESRFDNFKKVNLSEIADSIEYVRLEASPQCLLKSAWHVKLTSDCIFVSDFDGVYKFDRKGNFICKIGRQGKGPGEYINVINFTIDDAQQLVFVVDNWTDFIGIYDFSGKYIKSYRHDFGLVKIAIYDRSTIAYARRCNGAEENEHNLMLVDYNTGEVKNKYKDYYNIKGPHDFSFSTLTRYNNQMYFNDAFCDTMFVIDDKMNSIPYCVFHFGKYQIRDTHAQMAKISKVERIIPMKNHILFLYTSPVKDYFYRMGMYNTSTHELANITPFETQTYNGIGGFYNDFDGMIPFWPGYVGENGELMYYFHSYRLKEMEELSLKYNASKEYKSEKNHQFIKAALADQNTDDNGILMIVYPKK